MVFSITHLLLSVRNQIIFVFSKYVVDEGVESVENRISHGRGRGAHYAEIFLRKKF